MTTLSGADIHALLVELCERAVKADLFLVGGAAMALAYNTRRATRDVNAVFEPKQMVYEAAAAVG